MSIKAVLFDLDGTLLPMDQDLFIKTYFGSIAKKMSEYGYVPEEFIKTVWNGTMKMITNNGLKTNEAVFWEEYISVYGEKGENDKHLHQEYYENDFDKNRVTSSFTESSNKLIKKLKEKGVVVILATNPVFPSIATEKRIKWAGMEKEDFALVTTYENSSYCKPNPKYYEEILNKLNLEPEECVMVGNDVSDDMVAGTLGMKVFLLTDCLINSKGLDTEMYPQGNFDDLNKYLDSII